MKAKSAKNSTEVIRPQQPELNENNDYAIAVIIHTYTVDTTQEKEKAISKRERDLLEVRAL